jgi:hypothetical protein
LFFHRGAFLGFECGALFLAKSAHKCQDIFLNNFFTAPPGCAATCGAAKINRRKLRMLSRAGEDNESRKFETQFPSLLSVRITKPLFPSLASVKIFLGMSPDCPLTEGNEGNKGVY